MTKKLEIPGTDHQPRPYTGPSREETLALRREYLPPSLLTLYQEPFMAVEGRGQYLWDETGRQYLDGFAGIVTISVGHCHPKVVAAVKDQLDLLQHTTTIYVHPTVGQFAQKLASHMPATSGLKTTYFTNSGSEANDLAMLTCRQYTGSFDVIALRQGYHGGSQSTMALTAHSTWKYPTPHSFGVHHAMPGYCYRCPVGATYPSCDVRCAHDVADVIKFATPGKVACFIAEPIMGVGGTVVPPPEFFQIAYEAVRQAGGLCIADEVQTGFGRTGHHFWGFENWGVVPDMVTMAKGIGNGMAIGAMTTRPEIAQPLTDRIHFNTFGGNPVSAAQGLAVLTVMEEENLQENALEVGTHLKDRLGELQEKHALIGEIRGLGLMLGVELVRDRKTKEPANTEAVQVLEEAKKRGLLIGKGGFYGNTLRIKPPLCLTRADADFMADCLDESLAAVAATSGN